MKKVLSFLSNVFGFNKLSKHENTYLHESNIRTGIYMATIIVILEIWIILRQYKKYVIPALAAGGVLDKELFTKIALSIFLLILLTSLAVMIFSLFYQTKNFTKPKFITQISISAAPTLYSFFIFFEYFSTGANHKAATMNSFLIILYVLAFIIGASSIIYAFLRFYKNKRIAILEHVIISSFALQCLSFGIRVSYNDFFGGKEIICFLTMAIYIGCLLIYRPYVSLLLLTATFVGFCGLVYSGDPSMMENADLAKIIKSDIVNLITFYVSLTTVCFAIYHGRLSEARKSASLEKQAREDELTGLWNYNFFIDNVKQKITTTKGNIEDYVLLFIDIHNFKSFNDQRGFEAGNNFLITVGNMLRSIFRDSQYARQADDHFVVFTKRLDLEEKINKLNELVKKIDEEILLGINCGAYRLNDISDDPRRCIDRARYATFLVKKDHIKNFIEYDKSMAEAYRKRLYIINNIDNAVENGWIKPFYQPVVWSDSRELCGCEALARWFDPVYGRLSPSEFIPVLEEYRLIHKLDHIIFETVCKDLHNAIQNNLPVVPVSLNFSRLDFELMDATNVLEDLVAKYNLPRQLIHIEITESALIDSYETLSLSFNRFKELGYSLWLDDFGSGYSSFNVLKDYSFDVLKIDMVFLTSLENNEKAKSLLDSIIQMAGKIDMLTLTEGVETSEQADFLSKIGCTRLQGYLFGKPIPIEELYQKIASGELKISNKSL